MTERRPYTYVLLRYRHDPLAGEFANVGIVLHDAKSGFLGVRVRKTLGRLSAMFPGINGEALKGTLRSVQRGVQRLSKQEASGLLTSLADASKFAQRALPIDDSSFVWGPIGSGLSADPAQTLDKLYARFVSRYDEKTKANRDDAAVWKPVRDLLVERQIEDRLQAITIRSPLDHVEFDHAWKNGAWHCYQPLSFDLLSGESIRDKASKWAGQLLALENASEAFQPHFVVGAPSNPRLYDDYTKALAILQLGPGKPEVIEEAEISALVDRIETEIKDHEAVH